eukprot:TRINITY_DN1981_c0_g1_i1.p1 TRINITY_DN1981_c0_g1~~TRINITY_DN1981_c0_g1_i1.p1  ORF type:complete len:426 (+),score=38.69 TRINITY_DN1981_c0_g1_i1:57-1280(+)
MKVSHCPESGLLPPNQCSPSKDALLVASRETILRFANTNLHRFLLAVTPFFDPEISKDADSDQTRCSNCPAHSNRHYRLSELWSKYSDPFGYEVSLVLDGCEDFAYFVPYLSALHIVGKPKSSKTNPDDLSQIDGFKVCFSENASPNQRVPFIDRIRQISEKCPEVLSASTCDLIPERSWYAVSWYPIMNNHYTNQAIGGCFLTYHRFQVGGDCPLRHFFIPGSRPSEPLDPAIVSHSAETNTNSPSLDRPALIAPEPVQTFLSSGSESSSEDEIEEDESTSSPFSEESGSDHDPLDTINGDQFKHDNRTLENSDLVHSDRSYVFCCCGPTTHSYLPVIGCLPYKIRSSTWYGHQHPAAWVDPASTPSESVWCDPEFLIRSTQIVIQQSGLAHSDFEHMMLHRGARA